METPRNPESPAPPPAPRMRFTLFALLVVVTGCCILFAYPRPVLVGLSLFFGSIFALIVFLLLFAIPVSALMRRLAASRDKQRDQPK